MPSLFFGGGWWIVGGMRGMRDMGVMGVMRVMGDMGVMGIIFGENSWGFEGNASRARAF